MGIRRRLFELINGKLPAWASGNVRYEGIVKVMDAELSGTIRFAKRMGHPLPVWLVDNTTELVADTTTASRYIEIEPNSWIRIGSRIRLADSYEITVTDVTNEGSRLHFSSPLKQTFLAGTSVSLYSHPIYVSGDYVAPLQLFVVHSEYPLYRGDVVILSRTHQVELSEVVRTGTTPEGLGVYVITLDTPQDVSAFDGGILFLRAYPAYESPVMLTPQQPWVFDRLGGVFYEDMDDVREVDTLYLRDDASDPLYDLSSGPNTYIYRTDLPADLFVFGTRLEGSITWDTVERGVVLTTSALERCHLRYKFAPPVLNTQVSGWACEVTTTAAAKFLVQYGDVTAILVDFSAAGTYNVTIPAGTLLDGCTEFNIKVQATEGTQVTVRDWNLITQVPVRTMSHTTVAHVSGAWVWGSTGALSKRALRLTDVVARTGAGSLSAGFVTG